MPFITSPFQLPDYVSLPTTRLVRVPSQDSFGLHSPVISTVNSTLAVHSSDTDRLPPTSYWPTLCILVSVLAWILLSRSTTVLRPTEGPAISCSVKRKYQASELTGLCRAAGTFCRPRSTSPRWGSRCLRIAPYGCCHHHCCRALLAIPNPPCPRIRGCCRCRRRGGWSVLCRGPGGRALFQRAVVPRHHRGGAGRRAVRAELGRRRLG